MHKEKMKVYHGIPKSATDEHTIFYKEIPYTSDLCIMPTGYGSRITSQTAITKIASPSEITVDFWLYAKKLKSVAGAWSCILNCVNESNERQFAVIHDQYCLYAWYKNFGWNNGYKVPLTTHTHVRVICTNNKVFVYINGKLYFSSTNTGFNPSDTIKTLYIFDGYHDSNSEIYISDVHISNIDRGDYFPNLPQDFIDGKAIIKPRMSQQQIKGDPLYSQVTELLVDSSAKLPKPYSNIANSDGTYTHLYKPELSVLNANLWNNTSKLKIKGLNGEVISGVIDIDTALAKITKTPNSMQNTMVVDDVSKLSVGDTINLWYKDFAQIANGYTITNIDKSTNTITLSQTTNWGVGCYVIETTASSSSPIVKSEDGTTVVGTWSGLGTNEATFTLGTNTDLSGKDLYVTYSLNIPNGNSDFTELPYSVDKAYNEVGLEMKPVSEIVIEDDFRGKISGDLNKCPHTSKYVANSVVKKPSEFTAKSSQAHTSKLATNDNDCHRVSINVSTQIPQHLISFNIIEMVERKLGCEIPSRDKIQWLIDNIRVITFNWWGYGVSPTRNFADYQWWDGSAWTNTSRGHTMDSVTKGSILFNTSTNINKLLKATNDGMAHFLIFTDPSDGITNSFICTDYVNLQVTLKTDSTFTTLYCDNKRAREDSCNPVLVQKETKTVKRYVPSKECFVTECSYATIPSASLVTPTGAKKVSSHGRYFLSSKGTGGIGTKIWNTEYLGQFLNKNMLYKYTGDDLIEIPYSLFVDKSSYGDFASYFTQLELMDMEDNAIKYLLATRTDIGCKSAHGNSREFTKPLSLLDNKPESSFYGIVIYLVKCNNELYLLLSNTPYTFDLSMNKEGRSDLYKLPNRPLIK